MSTADVLSAQREEINRCVRRRESLLKVLFGVTQRYLHTAENSSPEDVYPEKQGNDLQAFLHSNDILLNRFFDSSTLPQSRRLDAQCDLQQRIAAEPKQPTHPAVTKHDTHSEQVQGRRSEADHQRQENARLDSVQRTLNDAGGTTKLLRFPASEGHAEPAFLESEKPHARESPATLDLESNSRKKGINAQGKEVQDEIAEPTSFSGSQKDHAGNEQTSNLTPPNSGRNLNDGENERNVTTSQNAQNTPDGGISKVASATLEEDPSRLKDTVTPQRQKSSREHGHSRGLSVSKSIDLPSRFIQDAYDESNSIMGIPPLGDDLDKNQQGGTSAHLGIENQQPSSALKNSVLAGINHDTSKDPTFSRRPPMRIDTGVNSQAKEPPSTDQRTANASEMTTPSKSAPFSSNAQSPPERMTTRVSSGALRHKSVSEILGETPKTSSPNEKGVHDPSRTDQAAAQSPKSASPTASPDIAAFRLRLNELKDKERSKLSTVIFAKPPNASGSRSLHSTQHQQPEAKEGLKEPRDYFLTFFAAQVYQAPRAPPLSALLRQAHKTLGTGDHYIELREKQDFKVLNQIKEMQHRGSWSLRQPERAAEPLRAVTHWDILLGQIKWMRTDFREERKFKYAGAKHLSEACAAWVCASADDRRAMQVKIRQPTVHVSQQSASVTPDLVHDGASVSTEDELSIPEHRSTDPPAAMFSLPPDVFVFGLNHSSVAEKILSELPCFEPAKLLQDVSSGSTNTDPDAAWRTPLVPVSKFSQGKLVPLQEGPPLKKPRLEDDDSMSSAVAQEIENVQVLQPKDENVALFNPENKHIRDRIHAGHAFRPPSEYAMPSRDFFECRSPSQWTMAEDDELRRLVQEYSYNWSLISNCLSSPNLYSSGAERRTPWECFERWISLEGLPAEMSKVPYFRTYHQRLQQAARTYEARQQALIQQQGGNPAQLPARRRSNHPYTVEKRKSNKPLHLVDAMRKHAKKKEAHLHKQQQAAAVGAMRKSVEVPKDRKMIPSAKEMSRMKYEKQMKIEEQNRLYRMQYAANQQNARKAAQQANGQVNGNIPNRNGVPGVSGGPNQASSAAAPQLRGGGNGGNGSGGGGDSSRPSPQVQRLMNGQPNGSSSVSTQNVPHAPMQSQMQVPVNQRGSGEGPRDMRLFQEAQRVQAEQAYLQQRQQQRQPQPNGHGSSPNMQNVNPLPQNNSTMLASMQGAPSPSINVPQGAPVSGSSPQLSQPQPQSLSSGMTPAVNQIQNQVKLRNPGASPTEIQRLTTEQLMRMSQQQTINQQAMAAAVGNSGGGLAAMQAPNPMLHHQSAMMANNHNTTYNTQQQYAAFMRMQQAGQSRTGSAGSAATPAMNGSRSNTPLVRTGSAQGTGPPRGPSQSPRPGTVGVAGAP